MLEQVVEGARSRLPDVIVPGGQTLTDSQPFTIDYINLGWQKIQQILVSMGYETLEDETVISALPVDDHARPRSAGIAFLDWLQQRSGTEYGIRPASIADPAAFAV